MKSHGQNITDHQDIHENPINNHEPKYKQIFRRINPYFASDSRENIKVFSKIFLHNFFCLFLFNIFLLYVFYQFISNNEIFLDLSDHTLIAVNFYYIGLFFGGYLFVPIFIYHKEHPLFLWVTAGRYKILFISMLLLFLPKILDVQDNLSNEILVTYMVWPCFFAFVLCGIRDAINGSVVAVKFLKLH